MSKIQGAIAILIVLLLTIASGTISYKFAENKTLAEAAAEQTRLNAVITRLEGEKHELELAIAEQNKAVEVAKAREQGAQNAAETAKAFAAQLAAFSKGRMDKLQAALDAMGTSDEVLKRYWELRQ